MTARDDAFVRRLERDLGQLALEVARPKVARASATLSQALRLRQVGGETFLLIPHYWAVFVHDGRGPIRARPGRLLVWYRDSSEDPRFRTRQTPPRRAQVRSLNRKEFRDALARFNAERAAGIKQTSVVITRQVRGTSPTNFFENTGGMAEFILLSPEAVQVRFRAHVLRTLGRLLGPVTPSQVVAGRPVVVRKLRRRLQVRLS